MLSAITPAVQRLILLDNSRTGYPFFVGTMQISAIGHGGCTVEVYETPRRLVNSSPVSHGTVMCDGLGGVMEAACRGAKEKKGLTFGIVPDTGDNNPALEVIVCTGHGHARNLVVVQSVDAVTAIGGSHVTLSEAAVALQVGIPVFGLNTWDIPGVTSWSSPEETVLKAVRA